MGDILTYAQAYQDKSFKEQPFNIVDSLIFCQLAYYKYDGSSFEKIFFDKKLWILGDSVCSTGFPNNPNSLVLPFIFIFFFLLSPFPFIEK